MKQLALASSMFCTALVMMGCATTQAPEPPTKLQVVDSMIAKYAEEATLQLRRLSENTGASRTSTPSAASSEARSYSGTPSGSTIAGKMGSIAVSPSEQGGPHLSAPPARTTPIPDALAVPPGLEKPLTLAWTGDLESLIFIIGKETGWKVVEPSGLRVSPVVIAINAQNKPAFEVLRDVGAIAGTAADVVISVNNQTLGVAYPKR